MLFVATITSMAIAYMLGWWYSQGWAWIMHSIRDSLIAVEESFSVPILLKTWFSPWKQIQTPSSLRNFFQAAIDNLISRLIGALIRTFMLITAIIMMAGIAVFGLLSLLLWPVFPFFIVILPLAVLVV